MCCRGLWTRDKSKRFEAGGDEGFCKGEDEYDGENWSVLVRPGSYDMPWDAAWAACLPGIYSFKYCPHVMLSDRECTYLPGRITISCCLGGLLMVGLASK